MAFKAGYTEDMVTEVWHDRSFSVTFTDAPSLLADLASYDGGNSSHLRYLSLSRSGVQLKVGEDTTLDSERIHTTEEVAYLVIDGEGILNATVVSGVLSLSSPSSGHRSTTIYHFLRRRIFHPFVL